MQTPKYFWSKTIALFILLAGLTNILSALLLSPSGWVAILETVAPLEIFNATRTLTVISGILLFVLARGIWQRKHRAWSLTIIVIAASVVVHLFQRASGLEVALLLLPLCLLLLFRQEFNVRSNKVDVFTRIKNLSFVLLFLALYVGIGFWFFRTKFHQRITPQRFTDNYVYLLTGMGKETLRPITPRARWFENSLFTIHLVFITLAFASLFSPFTTSQDDEISDEKIHTFIDLWGSLSTSYFALLNDKTYFFEHENNGVIAYGVSNGTAVILGEPLVEPEKMLSFLQDFCTYMMECGLSTVFYLITDASRPLFRKLRFTLLKIGEEALLKTAEFHLDGPTMKKLRNSVTHVQKTGMHFAWYPLNQIPHNVLIEIEHLHETWNKKHTLTRLSFSTDFFPLPHEPKGYVAVAISAQNTVEAVLSFLPYHGGKSLALDMILRHEHATSGVVETLLTQSIFFFRDHGIEEVSLGLVALADTKPDRVTPRLVQRGRSLLFRYFNQFYNYKSLFAFKNKFAPTWEPRYVAYATNAELLKVALAIIGIHTKHSFWRKKLKVLQTV